MKVVLLAGGRGTRLAEDTDTTPKVMIEVGGRPLLWHILRHYAHHGFREIFVALGHKGHLIRQYFSDLFTTGPRLSLDFAGGVASVDLDPGSLAARLGLRLHLVDTGVDTATGGRLLRLREWLQGEPFMVTYGDGVSNIDLQALRDFHRAQGAHGHAERREPPARFGRLVCEGDRVTRFVEKPAVRSPEQDTSGADGHGGGDLRAPAAWEDWINGGFFVFEPALFDLIAGDGVSLEGDVLPRLSSEGRLAAYRHRGFWQCMDTLQEKRLLQDLWASGAAPWKTWAD